MDRGNQEETVEAFRRWCQKEMIIRRKTDEVVEKVDGIENQKKRAFEEKRFERPTMKQRTFVTQDEDYVETYAGVNRSQNEQTSGSMSAADSWRGTAGSSYVQNGGVARTTSYGAEKLSKTYGNPWLREFTNTRNNQTTADHASALKCRKCSGTHYLDRCPELRQLKLEDRLEYVNKEKLCRNCLRFGHFASKCLKPQLCREKSCTTKHNYLLHKQDETATSENKKEKTNTYLSNHKDEDPSQQNNQWISLRTVPVILRTSGRAIRVNALLDDGSTTSYINERVANELGLAGEPRNLIVKVIGGEQQKVQSHLVAMDLADVSGKTVIRFAALTMKSVVGELKVINWADKRSAWKHLADVKFPTMGRKGTVDVLIGNDFPQLQRSLKEITGAAGEPVARLTPLGWTCIGGPGIGHTFMTQTSFVNTFLSVESLDDRVRRFWELEEVSEKKADFTRMEIKILSQAKSGMKLLDGRYQVNLPWKGERSDLTISRDMVERRLITLEKKFLSDQELKQEYSKIIESHEEKGYISEVEYPKSAPCGWLLPHFPVIRRDKETTKVRIVFDAAARSYHRCLNDFIETGPKLQNDLIEVLVRFRKFEVALMSDISEMYLQIGISPSDRRYLRFLWRKDGEIKKYEFNRLVFGLNTSPFLAQLVSQENARKYETRYPRAAEAIIKSTYMDDTLDSVASLDQARQLKRDLITVWGNAGMEVKKWASNSMELMEETPESERAKGVQIDDGSQIAVKTLGMRWNAGTDDFTFEIRPFNRENVTKRNLLSWLARIFDPLGMLSPYTIIGKMLMQKTWITGVEWDDKLSKELSDECRRWFVEAEELRNVHVPRVLLWNSARNFQIHIFSDASKDAFGVVSYLRVEMDQEIVVGFIIGKSKVAPVQAVSIPRMELLGACLAVKVMKKIAPIIGVEMKEVKFWTDSTDVLCWIRQLSRRFKTFVANRVSYIQEFTQAQQWHYVPTKMNPADLVSRGVRGCELPECAMWWKGPEFLQKDEADWPTLSKIENVTDKLESLGTTLQTVTEEKCMTKKVDYF